MTLFGGDSQRYEATLYADIAEWVRAMAEARSAADRLTRGVEEDSVKQDAALKFAGHAASSAAREFSEASRKQKDASNDATHTIEMNAAKQAVAMAGAAGSMRLGIAGLVAGAGAATPVVGALAGVVAALPATLGAAGLAMANFKSLNLGAIGKAADQIEITQNKLAAGTIKQSAATKAIANATAQLLPAQKAALPLWQQWANVMQGIAENSQRKILPALGSLGAAVKANGSTIRDAMSASAGSIATFLRQLSAFGQTPLFKAEFATLMKSSASTLGQFLTIAQSGIKTFLAIGNAAAPFVRTLGDMTTGLSNMLAAWSQSASGQSGIQTFLSATTQSLRIVGTTVKDLARILFDVFAPGFESSKLLVKGLNDVLGKVADFLASTRGKADVTQFWHIVATAIMDVAKAIGDVLPTALSLGKIVYSLGSAFANLVGGGLLAKIALISFGIGKIPGAAKIATSALGFLFANPVLGGLALTAAAVYLISRQTSGIGAAADTAAAKLAHLYDVKNQTTGSAIDVAQAQFDLSGALSTSGSAASAAAAARAKLGALRQGGATPEQIARQQDVVAAATRRAQGAYLAAAQARQRYTDAQAAAGKTEQDRLKATQDLGKSLQAIVTQSASAFAIPTGRSPNGPVTPPDTSPHAIAAAANAFNSAAQKSTDLNAAGKTAAAELAGVIRQANTINDAKIIAHIGAQDIGAGKTIADVRKQAIALGLITPKPKIDADTSAFLAKVGVVHTKLSGLLLPHPINVSLPAAPTIEQALDTINTKILNLTASPFTVKVNYATNGAPLTGGSPFVNKPKKSRGGAYIDGAYASDTTPVLVTGGEAILNPKQISMVDRGWTVMGALQATGAQTIKSWGGYRGGAKPKKGGFTLAPADVSGEIISYTGTIEKLTKKIADGQAAIYKDQQQARVIADEKRNLKTHTAPVAPLGGRKHNPQAYARYDQERANYRKFENDRKAEERRLNLAAGHKRDDIAADEHQLRLDRKQLSTAKSNLAKLKRSTSKAPGFPAFDSSLTTLLDTLGTQTNVLGADGNLSQGSPQTLGSIVNVIQNRIAALKGFLGNPKYKPFRTAIQDELRTDEQSLGQYRKQQYDASQGPTFNLQGILDAGGFTRAIAAASITDDNNVDDIAALTSERSFLQTLLTNPTVANSNANFTDVANTLASVNSQLSSFSSTTTQTADQSAQIAQLQTQLATSNRAGALSNAALGVFGGSGDIGSGGYANAFGSAQGSGPTIIVQTLHPADPATLTAIGAAATAGQSLQQGIPNSRTTVNL